MTLQETINKVFAKHDAECLLLTKQRDEARRLYCREKANPPPVNYSHPVHPCAVAAQYNWDCFKVQII